MFIELLFRNPAFYFTVLGVVIVSIVLHELGHALTATWQGDPTPRIRGQITWNPLAYMGWFGIGLAAVIGIAFGRVNVTPRLFRNRRWGAAMVSFAGPAVNLVLAVVASVVLGTASLLGSESPLDAVYTVTLQLNIALFFFNMIPVPPFDGFDVANGFFRLDEVGARLRSWHPWPMLIAFFAVIRLPFWDWVTDVSNILLSPWGLEISRAL